MRRTNKQMGNINSLTDLVAYRTELKMDYTSRGGEVVADLKQKALAFPFGLLRNKNETTNNLAFDVLKKPIEKNIGKTVKKVLPKRVGFVSRWLLGLLAGKVAKKFVGRVVAK